ncbi:uncharacterized protein LOC143144906, partial [Ptiloglossa arizonensis]|uniref:uncharacterized protein LOC143144906 n=1 Tax=Ptiloglossa arizonensis TaxID=3350558 RepID=UPI003FA01569
SPTENNTNKFTISVNGIKAEVQYIKILLKRYFTYWYKYIMIKHEKSIMLKRAITYYNLNCLKKCITNWKIHIVQKKKKKIIQDKVDKAHRFYSKSILQKCIKAWIHICEFTFQKFNLENAMLHYKNKLLKKYFNAWSTYYDHKIQKLNTKQYYVNESIADNMAQEKANIFYNFKCLQKGFSTWQTWYTKKTENAIKINKIKNILQNRNKHAIFVNWCLYVCDKKCKRRKIFLSLNFYKKKLLIKVLRKLYSYSTYRKEKKIKLSYLNDKSKAIIELLQNIYMEKWRKALYFTVQEKRKLSQAIQFWESNLTHKYFFYWKEFSQQYKIKVVHKKKLNELASNFLLKKYILHWHNKLQHVLEVHKKEIFVISTRDHKIMKKYLLFWEKYIIQKVKAKNDIEAAKQLHKEFFLREGLKQILRNLLYLLDYQYNMQLETAIMRSLKNYEILKEYFNKWHSLIYLKNNSMLLHKVIKNDDFQFIHSQTSCNNILDSVKNTYLVLPEYMTKENTISIVPNLSVTVPPENWSFNFVQLL